MDPEEVGVAPLSPPRDFEQIVEKRAENREHLRGRNNVTSCRSPTREFDTKWIKNELQHKRHLEFLRRRSVSPDPRGPTPVRARRCPSKRKPSAKFRYHLTTESETNPPVNGRLLMKLTPNYGMESDDPSTSKWTEKILQKKILRGAGVQTESGFVTVKESDVQRLADYLEEALWREEVVKKKLVALQESSSILLHSSNKIWTARCNEDLLRNQINALEAQLQVCLQKFPKDGLKRVVLQMEKQKVVYEEKALAALQKVTHEKTEALSKAETLQGALLTAKAEVLRWQSLYEELKLSSGQLKESRDLSTGQLQQLHSQLERSRAHEAELRHEVGSLLQEKRELQYNVGLLEEDNQVLIEAIQQLRDGSTESQDVTVQMSGPVEEAEPQQEVERDSQVEEQLRCTQDRLRLKEKECEELQTELDAIEQECQSSQARLTQCRDELRQLSHRRSSSRLCGSWWRVCVVLVLLLAAVGVAMLFLWHPPFREQVEDMYSDIETCIDDYLVEMASQHSGCFRPI
ncbi:TRAF3-interacting JNK-activating modulator [Diretmus argenteus]